MKYKHFIKVLSIVIVLVSVLNLCGCDQKFSTPQLTTDISPRNIEFSFKAQSSPDIKFSSDSAQKVLAKIEGIYVNYEYSDLYQTDEVFDRLDFDATVAKHQYSALDETGRLDADNLTKQVVQNSKQYLKTEKPLSCEMPSENYILQICEYIVFYINYMHSEYRDIDWQRVYCNLGNLKVLYDAGMLSYAQVSPDMVLSISKGNTEIVLNMKGEDGFSRVLLHEIMHITQLGCVCEKIENCERRAGISVYWDDFPLNTTDWTWFVEGSAERMMCNITGKDAVSYQYKMDYLCSNTMSVLLRDEVQADTLETLCFYDDPKLLFDTFGCKTQEHKEEIIKMMITLNILQTEPAAFFEAYKKANGSDPRENEDSFNQFRYSLKPSICITLSKVFYQNLTKFMLSESLSTNDLLFLITVFEGHLNQHLRYNDESQKVINTPFFESYNIMRNALFDAIKKDNPNLDITSLYSDYNIFASGDNLLNADLDMLPEEKKLFLAERAQWQYELLALGVRVPIV